MMNDMKLEAIRMRDGSYIVLPEGELGTIGWHPVPWEAIAVTASSKEDAIRKVKRMKKR